jgi:squalene synthase HpnC
MMTKPSLAAAYDYCLQLARSHYENFPVASLLLPKRLRQPICVIYAFARTADDFADEGDTDEISRLSQLNTYSAALARITENNYHGDNLIFIALADVIEQHQLPLSLFEDLLTAFKQDVVKSRYANFTEVLDYCRYSANPVGRLLLHLDKQDSNAQLQQSDAICSALQLINFYQDIEQDYVEQDRVYIPLDELHASGLSEADLVQPDTVRIAPLIRDLYRRTSAMMQEGFPLGLTLTGRMGWEVRAMTLGGIQTLALLAQQKDRELLTRPRLSRKMVLGIVLKSLSKRIYKSECERLLKLSAR